MLTVVTTGLELVFVAVKEGIVAVEPAFERPIDVCEFVQE
jgi:hypothetical protein